LVDIADINGDDTLDVVATAIGADKVIWYEAPNWNEHVIDDSIGGPYGIFCADMDADSDPDAVVGIENDSLIVWYENDGAGSVWSQHIIDDRQAGGGLVSVADIDDDLDPDVVVMGYFADSVFWYENVSPDWTRHFIGHLGTPGGLFVGDMDHDLDLDIVAAGYSSHNIVWFKNMVVGIGPLPDVMPSEYVLFQNYPNSFNPSTTIEFALPKAGMVTLKIYNILGEEVMVLVSEKLSAGIYKYEWDAAKLASDVYIYRLEAGSFTKAKKLVLLR
jgi:hypothetical protein